jgi:signal transduction histidine kinase
MALAVTTTALLLAVAGLILVDVWRYRVSAENDTTLLARAIAENAAAAVLYQDADEAAEILATAGVPPSVRRACLYLDDRVLFARFERSPQHPCATTPELDTGWTLVAAMSPIVRNANPLGLVYVERELSDLWTRVWVATAAGLVMLILAGAVAIPIANRLNRRISTPIEQLAAAARAMNGDAPSKALPPIDTGPDEIGELVRVLSDTLQRVSHANDALRRKEAEGEDLLRREREASRLKDEFLATVSHELRTPLSAIVGWVQVLATMKPDPELTARGIATIARNARAQTRLIDDLVDVSRIVARKLVLKREPADLREIAAAAAEAVQGTAEAKAIVLNVALPPDACLVDGDRERLQHAVANVLSNAIKFTGAGGTVDMALHRREGWHDLSVADTGAGIDAAFLPHVFDRFRQADGTLTREHGGLGLGLAIVKELTALHGGTVSAASDGRGLGATFVIRLPALPDHGLPSAAPHHAPDSQTLLGIRVLAVDDNHDALEVLETALTAAGAQVRTASSGADALSMSEAEAPDVLLCDLAMPDMDGTAVLRRMRARLGAAGRTFRAIALSAHASDEHRARSRAAGFQLHLVKPFAIEALVRTIASVTGR